MDVGWGELLILGVFALLIFGPDKLPKAAAEAGRYVRKLRTVAQGVQQDLAVGGVDLRDIKKELGGLADIKRDLTGLTDLHPKRIITSALAEPTSSPNGSEPASGSEPVVLKPTTQSPSYLGPSASPTKKDAPAEVAPESSATDAS
ncbi:MAG: twin-arginine translocase TatA/TatE family subunit [Candidatus Nanopelagicales bacterium]|nr:twin-arginine translocase TatA/TatE family subunit [Candidatus Nanopelagicales bacterium]MDZ4249431.1 twin-arginine translocase TatA/TatE family subunit [Candidatus Nanopelagicales bacterium]